MKYLHLILPALLLFPFTASASFYSVTPQPTTVDPLTTRVTQGRLVRYLRGQRSPLLHARFTPLTTIARPVAAPRPQTGFVRSTRATVPRALPRRSDSPTAAHYRATRQAFLRQRAARLRALTMR